MSLSVGYLISFKRSRRIERRVRGARKRDGLAQRRPKDEIDFSTERRGLARGLYTKDGILNQWPERVRIVFMALFVAYLLAIFYRSYRSPLKLPVLADVCDSDSSFSCAIRLWREKRKRETRTFINEGLVYHACRSNSFSWCAASAAAAAVQRPITFLTADGKRQSREKDKGIIWEIRMPVGWRGARLMNNSWNSRIFCFRHD